MPPGDICRVIGAITTRLARLSLLKANGRKSGATDRLMRYLRGCFVICARSNASSTQVSWLRNRSAAAANFELAINCGVLLADMLEIAGVFRWNVTFMRLTVANRRAADRSRVLHQRRRRGRACEPSRGCRASDGLRNCCAIAELSQQHNYSDQVSHDSISPVWDTFSRRGPARDRRRPQGHNVFSNQIEC